MGNFHYYNTFWTEKRKNRGNISLTEHTKSERKVKDILDGREENI